MSEFELIARYFTRKPAPSVSPSGLDLGIGDDAALVRLSPGHQLAISADMSVAGTHFFDTAEPYDIGWKAMAVNLSDMAAMGAQPKWATLSIALPQPDPLWLQGFSDGLFACADHFSVALIGGDTTRGPLNISISILGEVPIGLALRRDGAKVGDDIWVSGQLGGAALWLQSMLGQLELTIEEQQRLAVCMHRPQPRVELGLALRGIAHSALDISDGLLADLGHLLKASQSGAILEWSRLPVPQSLHTPIPESQWQQAVLAGGDDYELCFTAPVAHRAQISALSHRLGVSLTRIGTITMQSGLSVQDGEKHICLNQSGYRHFA